MAFNKFNRLHLHVTDAQSWPLEIESLPNLASKGAYAPELTYSSTVLKELQVSAADRGIELYLELDMPGHTASIGHAFPELIAAFNKQPDWGSWGASPPSGTLKLNSGKVNDFIDVLFHDLLPRIGKFNTHFHTGGDEVNLLAYSEDETVNSTKFQIIRPHLQDFIDRIHGKLRAAGITPIVWQEMALDWNLALDKRVIVQAWQDSSAVDLLTRSGHQVIVGTNDFWVGASIFACERAKFRST
jgi:hexosaminidase